MNETIQLLRNHRSVRDFDTEKEVSEAQIQMIMEAALAGPNWINGQQVSVIEVREPERKAALAKAAGNQRWIEEAPVFLVFCMDLYRAKLAAEKNGTEFKIVEDLEAIIVGSTDVGIALGSAVIAAESMGLGIVPIGGLRRNPQAFVDLLKLPKYVFPISGLVVGYPRSVPAQKPRLPIKATLLKEQYDTKIQKEIIDQYDQAVSSYMSGRTGGKDTSDWSSKVAQFYDNGFEQYAKNSSSTVKNQRFQYK